MELAANKVKNTRIHERAAGVKWLIYTKALLFDIDNNNFVQSTVSALSYGHLCLPDTN